MTSFVIRHIPKEQFQDSLSLSEFAFQYEVPQEEREKKISLLKEKECWGAYVDGKLAARMTVMDMHTWLYGKRYAMGGIASVATWPEYRRGGLVSGLLSNALQVMREQGQSLSYLHPFQFAFYRKFGWETYTETKKYEIPTTLLPKLPHQPGHIVRVGRDMELLNTIYQQYAMKYNGTLDRDAAWWNNRIFDAKKGTAAVYYDASGSPSGYVHYEVKNQICRIHELVYLHHEAWKGLWRFIADHDSMIEKVTISVPADDRMSFLLDNPRIKQEVIPYFMARIVDVKLFLEQFPFNYTGQQEEGASIRLMLKVTDVQAEWNNGEFMLEVSSDGCIRVEKTQEASGYAPTVACGIGTLTTMFMGYQRPAFLYETEQLEGDPEAVHLLESVIPQGQTYLPDFF